MDDDEYFDPKDYEEDNPIFDPSEYGPLTSEDIDWEAIKEFEDVQASYPASTLVGYENFKKVFNLYGESYEPLRRALYYSILGALMADNPLYLNNKRIDIRFNLFVCLKSGYGKSELKDLVRRTMQGLGLTYVSPSSLHPEQLVGKVIQAKVDKHLEYTPVIGYLGNRYIVIDEAIHLLCDKDHEESRNYIKTALDCVGTNEITKKLVDHPNAQTLKYKPNCTFTFFFQPVDLPIKLLITGLMRRGVTIWLTIPDKERELSIVSVINDVVNKEESGILWTNYLEHLKKVMDREFNWKFSAGYRQKLLWYTLNLYRKAGVDAKAKEIAGIFLHDLMHNLVKLSALIAADNFRDEITVADLETAYRDMEKYWDMTIEYTKNKLKSTEPYNTLGFRQGRCLEILYDRGCLSEETSTLTISAYDEIMAKELDLSVTSATQTYRYPLEKVGYIDSRQVGRTGSKVWLTQKGREMLIR